MRSDTYSGSAVSLDNVIGWSQQLQQIDQGREYLTGYVFGVIPRAGVALLALPAFLWLICSSTRLWFIALPACRSKQKQDRDAALQHPSAAVCKRSQCLAVRCVTGWRNRFLSRSLARGLRNPLFTPSRPEILLHISTNTS